MKTKKVLFAVLLVAVLLVAAGSASARGWGGHRGGGYGPRGGGYGGCGYGGGWCWDDGYGPRGGRGGYYNGGGYDNRYYGGSEMPAELQNKLADARKIEIDLHNELGKTPVNKERALELHKQHSDIMRELYDWQFQNRFQ